MKNRSPFTWMPACTQAFHEAKAALSSAAHLTFPRHHASLILHTDASDKAMGASLDQVYDNRIEPLGFYSKKFSPTETRYSAFDRELLAIYLAVRHFSHLLEGRRFTIRTDHKPLVHALMMNKEPGSDRQRRQLFHLRIRLHNRVCPGRSKHSGGCALPDHLCCTAGSKLRRSGPGTRKDFRDRMPAEILLTRHKESQRQRCRNLVRHLHTSTSPCDT